MNVLIICIKLLLCNYEQQKILKFKTAKTKNMGNAIQGQYDLRRKTNKYNNNMMPYLRLIPNNTAIQIKVAFGYFARIPAAVYCESARAH